VLLIVGRSYDAADHTKLTGAGGGGCVFALLEDGTTAAEREILVAKLAALGMKCFAVDVGGPGLTFE
jgi:mevalonate kinase